MKNKQLYLMGFLASLLMSTILLPHTLSQPIIADKTGLSYLATIKYEKGNLKLIEVELAQGDGPDRNIQPYNGYMSNLLSKGDGVLNTFKFGIPLIVISENPEWSDYVTIDETEFSLSVPYHPLGKEIQIFDPEGNLKLTIDVSQFARPKAKDSGPKTAEKPADFTLVLILVVIIIAGAGGFVFYKKKKKRQGIVQENRSAKKFLLQIF